MDLTNLFESARDLWIAGAFLVIGVVVASIGSLIGGHYNVRAAERVERMRARRAWRERHVSDYYERVSRRVGDYALLSLLIKTNQRVKVEAMVLSFLGDHFLLRDYPPGVPGIAQPVTELGNAEEQLFKISAEVLKLSQKHHLLGLAYKKVFALREQLKQLPFTQAIPFARHLYQDTMDEFFQRSLVPLNDGRAAIEKILAAIERYLDD